MSDNFGWVGVDLDGTLAEYHGWVAETHIGPPIPAMVDRVKAWIAAGVEVKIMTARVSTEPSVHEINVVRAAIIDWCIEHLGVALPITCVKDYRMVQLWDDRAVRVELNTGRIIGDEPLDI